jgi:hypothetical protein
MVRLMPADWPLAREYLEESARLGEAAKRKDPKAGAIYSKLRQAPVK